MNKRLWQLLSLLMIGMLVLVGCSKEDTSINGGKKANDTLVIGAAASLNEAFTELGEIFEEQHPGWRVEFSFASSGNLKTSIEQGAPMDIFASAADKQMNDLRDTGHVMTSTIKPFVKNELVAVVSKDSQVRSLEELVSLDRIALGEPDTVPAGQYGKESLTNLGYWDEIKAKLIFTKDVRQALFYVEQGEVDGAFVYATDAAKSDLVQLVAAMPADSYQVPSYPIGILTDTKKLEKAEKWIELVLSQEGQEVLGKYGFQEP